MAFDEIEIFLPSNLQEFYIIIFKFINRENQSSRGKTFLLILLDLSFGAFSMLLEIEKKMRLEKTISHVHYRPI